VRSVASRPSNFGLAWPPPDIARRGAAAARRGAIKRPDAIAAIDARAIDALAIDDLAIDAILDESS